MDQATAISEDLSILDDLRPEPDLTVEHDLAINHDLMPPADDLGPTGIPAPHPIEPASSGFTTSTTVRFRWSLTTPADGARLEICGDRACTDIRQTKDVTGTSTTAVITPTPGASRVFFFRLTGLQGATVGTARSATWSFSVNGLTPSVTGSWGTLHDFDGDGFSDVVGGSPSSSKARMFRGHTPIGGTPTADVEFTGVPSTVKLSDAIFGAGDLDGDGFSDLALGTETSLLLYHGRPSWPATLNDAAASNSIPLPSPARHANLAAAGDVNGDGYGDLVVGDPGAGQVLIYFGSFFGAVGAPTPISRADSGFGTSVAGACDVNADGFADVIVGGNGNATVYLGSAGGLGSPIALNPLPAPAGFGASVACAGDVNADGYADVIVGAPLDHSAWIFHGGVSGTSTSANGVLRKSPVIGRRRHDQAGRVVRRRRRLGRRPQRRRVQRRDGGGADPATGVDGLFVGYIFSFFGRPGGIPVTAVGGNTAHQKTIGSSSPTNRRQVSQYAGDINGDGIGDLVAGAPTRNTGGTVEVYAGVAYTSGASNEGTSPAAPAPLRPGTSAPAA